jgi:pyridoxine 4-dehydrogenase
MLAGQIKSFEDIPEKDIRKLRTRFQPENFENSFKLVRELKRLLMRKKGTCAQLVLD